MSNVLLEYEKMSPTVMGILDVFTRLKDKCICEFKLKKAKEISSKDIIWSDIILSIRGMSSFSVFLARCATSLNRIHISYYDDDILSLPVGYVIPKIRVGFVRKMLKYTDIILAVNKRIGEKYSQLTKNQRFVLFNAIVDESEIVAPRKLPQSTVKVLYAANKGHVILFNQYILPVLPLLLERYAGKLSFTFIGVKPVLELFRDKMEIKYIDSMPLKEYRNFVKNERFDIGIAPLGSDSFSASKYYNKYIEYSLSGIVGIYSCCEPYTNIVHDRVNGFLAENTTYGWFDTLCTAIQNFDLRLKCIEEAQFNLKESFCPDKVLSTFIGDLPELYKYKAPTVDIIPNITLGRSIYLLFLLYDKLALLVLFWRKLGFIGMLEKVNIHIAEKHRLEERRSIVKNVIP